MLSSSADLPPAPGTGLDVRPFRALTYRRRDPDVLARVSSPAYDLVTPAGRQRLADADPHNIVRLILPRVDECAPGAATPTDSGPVGGTADASGHDRSARLAAATLRAWRQAGVLEGDDVPALWVYELAPTDGTPPTTGWLAAVALPPRGSTAVLPHEDTYPVAVEGRRALLAATRTDLEPIVLAHDPDRSVADLAARACSAAATLEVADDEGVRHRLWQVSDSDVVARVRTALRRNRAVIADGHHRFAAAQAHHRMHPDLPGSDAVLALVTSSGPGGLRVEAIHRVVPQLALGDAVTAAAEGFAVDEVVVPAGTDPGAAARRWLARAQGPAFLLSDGRRLVAVTRPTDATLQTVPITAPPAWRGLDVVLAHHGLVERLWQVPDDPDSLMIAHDVPEALRSAAELNGTALLLRAPSPGDVASVARSGARMPRKSTLFVPKPRTGLVLRPLE